ncbi:MAG: hypothetical protein R6U32_06735 [Candidatus Woesearchaeota archaeon]
MAEKEDYDIVPHEEVLRLRKEVEDIKQHPFGSTKEGKELLEAIKKLSESMDNLTGLFQEAAEQMKLEERESEMISKKIDPLFNQMNELIDENKKIAKGIIAVADMIKKERPAGSKESGESGPQGSSSQRSGSAGRGPSSGSSGMQGGPQQQASKGMPPPPSPSMGQAGQGSRQSQAQNQPGQQGSQQSQSQSAQGQQGPQAQSQSTAGQQTGRMPPPGGPSVRVQPSPLSQKSAGGPSAPPPSQSQGSAGGGQPQAPPSSPPGGPPGSGSPGSPPPMPNQGPGQMPPPPKQEQGQKKEKKGFLSFLKK